MATPGDDTVWGFGSLPLSFLLPAALSLLSALMFRTLQVRLERQTRLAIRPEQATRVVGTVHAAALVAIGLAWEWVCLGPAPPAGSPAHWGARAAWVVAAKAVPLGYLAHSAHRALTLPTPGVSARIVHHAVFAALAAAAPARYPRYTAQVFLTECSVPLLLAWWALLTARARKPGLLSFCAISAALLAIHIHLSVAVLARVAVEAYGAGEWVAAATAAALTLHHMHGLGRMSWAMRGWFVGRDAARRARVAP